MLSPATSINCASSEDASINCGVTYWYDAVNARGRSGRSLLRSWNGGYHHPAFCTPIPTHAFTPLILHKSRVRKRARTDLRGGRLVKAVPTATITTSLLTDRRPSSRNLEPEEAVSLEMRFGL